MLKVSNLPSVVVYRRARNIIQSSEKLEWNVTTANKRSYKERMCLAEKRKVFDSAGKGKQPVVLSIKRKSKDAEGKKKKERDAEKRKTAKKPSGILRRRTHTGVAVLASGIRRSDEAPAPCPSGWTNARRGAGSRDSTGVGSGSSRRAEE